MAFNDVCGLYLIIFWFCYTFAYAQEVPITPEKFYALRSSDVEVPCAAASQGENLRWIVHHEDASMRARSRIFSDPLDPDLLTIRISHVQPSDAGDLVCTNGWGESVVQLIVIDELSYPEETTAQVTAPDEVKVKWVAPRKNPDFVRGYHIYVAEVTGRAKQAKFTLDTVSANGREEFLLPDMKPGATYEIQVVALYAKGAAELEETEEGPKSPIIRIKTPKFDVTPFGVSARPWKNSTLLVTWQTPRDADTRGIDGFQVLYKSVSPKRKLPPKEMTVFSPGPGGRWQAILSDLRTRVRYKIEVVAFTGGDKMYKGGTSTPVFIRFDGFDPEISISAIALGPETVLLTVQTVGPSQVDKLRLLYSDESATKWDRVKSFNTSQRYAVVSSLQPRSRYFFMAKASVNRKARKVITHAMTLPSALTSPSGVTVSAQTDNSVLVTWNHESKVKAVGFVVRVDKMISPQQFASHKQEVIQKTNEALIQDLHSGEKYQVKVQPFNLESMGMESEPVLFSIAAADEMTPTPETAIYSTYRDTYPTSTDRESAMKRNDKKERVDTDYEVRLLKTHKSPTEIEVKWVVDKGDLRNIRAFRVSLTDDNGRVLMRQAMQQDKRSLTLTSLTPGQTYILNLQTLTPAGKVDTSSLELLPSPTDMIDPNMEPMLNVAVVEIRDVTARVDFSAVSPDPAFIGRYRLRVKDLDVGTVGNTIFDRHLRADTSSINLQRLKPDRLYSVIIDATPRRGGHGGTPLSEEVVFRTAPIGSYMPPVSSNLPVPSTPRAQLMESTYESSAQPIATATTVTVTAAERYETSAPITAAEPTSTPAYQVTDGGQYTMTLRAPSKTQNSVFIRWAVDRGDLTALRSFLVTIKGDGGRTLLQQQLGGKQRSITIQSLTPNTKYLVSLKAAGNEGILAEKELSVQTPSSDTMTDTSPPHLDLEANEVRSDSARLEWLVVHAKPNAVDNYKIQVLYGGPNGFNLLNQSVPAESQSLNLQKLSPNKRYHVIVEAVDRWGVATMTASLTFDTPSPGTFGTPVRQATVDTRQARRLDGGYSMTPSPTPETTPIKLAINSVRGMGAGAMYVQWSRTPPTSTDPDRGTLVRYTQIDSKNMQPQRYKLQHVSAGRRSIAILGLEPGKTYGFQVAPVTSSGQPVGWSAMVRKKSG